MNNRRHISTVLGTVTACCLGLLVILAVGCKKEPEKPAPGAGPSATAQEQPKQQATKFVNNRCPIMGNKMDLANVPKSLTRTYKNQKVAFCCAGCPVEWDKLSDAEKDIKLAKVLSKKSN